MLGLCLSLMCHYRVQAQETRMTSEQNPPHVDKTEVFALRLSIIGYFAMGSLGVVFFLLTRSEAIMLDGVYSFVSFIGAILAARVARLVEIPGSETFQFGYAHFEPLLNTVRGLLILLLCGFALFSAIDALMHGGRALSAGYAVIYGISAASGCLLLSLIQSRYAKRIKSPLLVVDARNWLVDGILSLGVAIAFIIAYLLQGTFWEYSIPYVDPTMVIVLVLSMIAMPLITLRDNIKQIMQVAPEKPLREEVSRRFAGIATDLPVVNTDIRMVKVGRFFYVMVHLVVAEDFRFQQASDLDEIRYQIANALRDCHPRLIIDVVFTTDERWIIGDVAKICAG